MYEYELEALPELEGEYEAELEGDQESEQFFGALAGLARQAIQSPALRRIGLSAARSALGGLGSLGGAIGGAISPQGASIGRQLGAHAGRYLSGMLPQREFEGEFEGEFEWEAEEELNPLRRVYADALMEHMGHAAATVQSEAEAEAFIGSLVPLAARLLPQAAPTLMRTAPQLIRGLAGVTRTLRRSPRTRPLVRAVPAIARRAAVDLARQAAQGRPPTPQRAMQTLARQTYATIGSPQRAVQAYRRSRALDQRYHQQAAHEMMY